MMMNEGEVDLTALADGTLTGPEWDAWLAAHPALAAEVAIARRVRALVAQLRAVDVAVPADFEAHVLARVHANRTLLELLELGLAGVGRTLLELLDLLFAVQVAPDSTTRSPRGMGSNR